MDSLDCLDILRHLAIKLAPKLGSILLAGHSSIIPVWEDLLPQGVQRDFTIPSSADPEGQEHVVYQTELTSPVVLAVGALLILSDMVETVPLEPV